MKSDRFVRNLLVGVGVVFMNSYILYKIDLKHKEYEIKLTKELDKLERSTKQLNEKIELIKILNK